MDRFGYFHHHDEPVITKEELEERDEAIRDLKQKFSELQLEMDYQLKRKDMSYQEEVKAMKTDYETKIDDLNLKIEELVATKQEHDANYYSFVENTAKEQKDTIEKLQSHYNTRLISEFEKYNELQLLLEETVQDYETKLVNLDTECKNTVSTLVEDYEARLAETNKALVDATKEAKDTYSESEEMKRQIEEDADAEILQLSVAYEKKLKKEEGANEKLRADSNIMKRNIAAMNKEIESKKGEVMKLQHEAEKTKSTILILEKEVQSLRKDLVDHDVNVMGKEKVIYDLKKTNSELEKYKFVLDYKIKELKKMIEPKEREIIYLKQQNLDMEQELLATVAIRNGLELQVSELTSKLRGTHRDFKTEKGLRVRLQVLVTRIRAYLSRCMNLLQDHHALKATVKEMYMKYGHTLDVGVASTSEQEAICELVRQKNYLELSLNSMKKKMAKEVELTRDEQLKVMHENMLLVFEINNLRRELKLSRDRLQAYEISLGILPSNFSNAKTGEVRMKLHAAIYDKELLKLQHDKALQEKQAVIDAQTGEIIHLTERNMRTQEEAGIDDVSSDTVFQL